MGKEELKLAVFIFLSNCKHCLGENLSFDMTCLGSGTRKCLKFLWKSLKNFGQLHRKNRESERERVGVGGREVCGLTSDIFGLSVNIVGLAG